METAGMPLVVRSHSIHSLRTSTAAAYFCGGSTRGWADSGLDPASNSTTRTGKNERAVRGRMANLPGDETGTRVRSTRAYQSSTAEENEKGENSGPGEIRPIGAPIALLYGWVFVSQEEEEAMRL